MGQQQQGQRHHQQQQPYSMVVSHFCNSDELAIIIIFAQNIASGLGPLNSSYGFSSNGGQCGCSESVFLQLANQIRSVMPPGPQGIFHTFLDATSSIESISGSRGRDGREGLRGPPVRFGQSEKRICFDQVTDRILIGRFVFPNEMADERERERERENLKHYFSGSPWSGRLARSQGRPRRER